MREERALKKKSKIELSAVILAAGSSERFCGDKLSANIGGVSVLERTLSVFEESPEVDEIILVARSAHINEVKEITSKMKLTKLEKIVAGGNTRQQSAYIGLEATSPTSKYIAIHDAARCLVTPEIIRAVLCDAKRCRAAAAAHHVTDTVKYANVRGYIQNTINRDFVWLVSTPQIFLTNLYRAAAYTAVKDGFEGTDDCSLAERLGFEVRLTEVGADNIKITFQDDILRAEEILCRRENKPSIYEGG